MEFRTEEPLLSVIVPIYNTDVYLEECVRSIMAQEYRNLEIILVNEGSTDTCPQICDRLVEEDNRVVAVHRQYGNLSSARNAGLDAANGELIAFVDSDDVLHPTMYRALYHNMKTHGADISTCGTVKFNYSNIPKYSADVDSEVQVMSGCDLSRAVILGSFYLEVVVWNKIYASRLFAYDPVRFADGRYFEDNMFVAEIACRASIVVRCQNMFYGYRQYGKNAFILFKNDPKLADTYYRDLTFMMEEQQRISKDYQLDIDEQIMSVYIDRRLSLLRRSIYMKQGKLLAENYSRLRNSIISDIRAILYSPYVKAVRKVEVFIFFIAPIAYTPLIHFAYAIYKLKKFYAVDG